MFAFLSVLFAQNAVAAEPSYTRGGELPAYNLQLFSSQPDSWQSFLLAESSLFDKSLFLRVAGHQSNGLLLYTDFHEKEHELLSGVNQSELYLGYNLGDLLRLAVGMPIVVGAESSVADLKGGMGDIQLDAKLRLTDVNANNLGFAFAFQTSLATGSVEAPLANEANTWNGKVIIEKPVFSKMLFRLNIGHQNQPSVTYENFEWGSSLIVGSGLSLPLGWVYSSKTSANAFGTSIEIQSHMPYSVIGDMSKHVTEGFAGGWVMIESVGLLLRGGGGFGLTATPGTPRSRALFDATYMLPF